MLEALRFVKGAVARKDFMPVLTHFNIAEGRIVGSDGNLALASPISLSITASPKASTFAAAIASCESSVAIVQLPNGSIAIKSGAFRSVVECSTDTYPSIPIGGVRYDLPGAVLPALKLLQRFVSEDASRPWSQGVLFRGKSAYATNNVILVEYWTGVDIPVEVNIPTKVVDEMVRINEEPEYIEIASDENKVAVSITVRYSEGRWLFHPLVREEWPDVGRYLNKKYTYLPFPNKLFGALDKIKPFVVKDQSIYFSGASISTTEDIELGAAIEVEGLDHTGRFSLPQLRLLDGIVESIDFTQKPAGFLGKGLRGVIYGMR